MKAKRIKEIVFEQIKYYMQHAQDHGHEKARSYLESTRRCIEFRLEHEYDNDEEDTND